MFLWKKSVIFIVAEEEIGFSFVRARNLFSFMNI